MTLVVDASAVAELLLGTADGRAVAAVIGDDDLVAPAHLSVEVASVMRGLSLGGHLDDSRVRIALRELAELRIELLPAEAMAEAAWELRHDVGAYDAFYVVAARSLACRLVTLDRRLAAAVPDCALLPA